MLKSFLGSVVVLSLMSSAAMADGSFYLFRGGQRKEIKLARVGIVTGANGTSVTLYSSSNDVVGECSAKFNWASDVVALSNKIREAAHTPSVATISCMK